MTEDVPRPCRLAEAAESHEGTRQDADFGIFHTGQACVKALLSHPCSPFDRARFSNTKNKAENVQAAQCAHNKKISVSSQLRDAPC